MAKKRNTKKFKRIKLAKKFEKKRAQLKKLLIIKSLSCQRDLLLS